MTCVPNIQIIQKTFSKYHARAGTQVLRTLSKVQMERFAKIVNDFKPLIIFGKQSTLYVSQGFEYIYAPAESTNFFTVKYRLNTNFQFCTRYFNVAILI